MKVLVAVDSFKGSLSSKDIAIAIEKGVKKVYINSEVIKVPIADGGEGTVDALVYGTKGEFIEISVSDPLLNKISATYGILGDKKTAVIEMATASGLTLVPMKLRNPMKTTTYGTGQLIKDAISRGCRNFIIGIGGSATNDAGIGLLKALGIKFLDKNSNELTHGGEQLNLINSIDTSNMLKELKECHFLVACDVDNPFYGLNGAAHIYGRQKGATEQMIIDLDKGLEIFSNIIKKELNRDISDIPGAGAAGGLGGGILGFLNAKLVPGVEIILEQLDFKKKLENVDIVITGEGRLDSQSVMGKAPIGIAKFAKKFNIPVIGIAGSLSNDAHKVHNYGIDSIFSIMNYPMTLDEAMDKKRATSLVEKNSEEIFRLIKAVTKQ